MSMNCLPLCLAQRWEGLGYPETTQMPVAPFFAHRTTGDNADSALVASPRKGRAASGGSLWASGHTLGGTGAVDSTGEPPVTGDSEAELFVKFMRPIVRSSLCTGRRDGGWNEFPAGWPSPEPLTPGPPRLEARSTACPCPRRHRSPPGSSSQYRVDCGGSRAVGAVEL